MFSQCKKEFPPEIAEVFAKNDILPAPWDSLEKVIMDPEICENENPITSYFRQDTVLIEPEI